MRSKDRAVYVVSVAAELAGMHPQTLRISRRRAFVQPAPLQGGNRRYSDVDIDRLRRMIQELAGEGHEDLEGIRRVMGPWRPMSSGLGAENVELRKVAPRRLPKPIVVHHVATSCPFAKRYRCSVAHGWEVRASQPFTRLGRRRRRCRD